MTKKLIQIWLFIGLANAPCLSDAQTASSLPDSIPGAERRVYKTIGDADLTLHIFQPAEGNPRALRPAIVFFFGGAWRTGTVNQFVPHCRYFAARGMVAIVAEYRVRSRHGVTPFECVADAKSAMRWVRGHASEYRINKKRIVAAGGSAGGHLAASTAVLEGFDEPDEDMKISSRPDALVLFNPALDMHELRKYMLADSLRAEEISPVHHIRKGLPPTIIFHGTADPTVPFTQATRFCEAMKKHGNACEVVPFEGRVHGFFNHGRGDGDDYKTTVEKADEFLVSLGYLKREAGDR